MARLHSLLLLLITFFAGQYSPEVSAAPPSHVTLSVSAPTHLDANNSVTLTLTFSNPAGVAATDVQADVALLVARRIERWNAPSWSCANVDFGAPGTLRCTTPRIDAHGSRRGGVGVRSSSGGDSSFDLLRQSKCLGSHA